MSRPIPPVVTRLIVSLPAPPPMKVLAKLPEVWKDYRDHHRALSEKNEVAAGKSDRVATVTTVDGGVGKVSTRNNRD